MTKHFVTRFTEGNKEADEKVGFFKAQKDAAIFQKLTEVIARQR